MAAPGYWVGGLTVAGIAALFAAAVAGLGGPDPAKWLLHQSGVFAVVLLLATLAVSPLRRRTGRAALLRWRRPLGLAAFSLAALHLFVYAVLYESLDAAAIIADITRRPYILVGLLAFLLLVPLAATSTRRWQQRLGAQRWQRLHRAVYVIVPLAIVHQGMAQKADLGQTLLFSAIAGCFLLERAWVAGQGANARGRGGKKVEKGR